jgi:hypothetical protein
MSMTERLIQMSSIRQMITNKKPESLFRSCCSVLVHIRSYTSSSAGWLEWSLRWMGEHLNLFLVIGLSPGGRPLLSDGEVEIQWIDDVKIQTDTREDIFPCAVASILLTNMNLMVLLPQQPLRVCAWALHYKQIVKIEDCATTFRSSKRIRFHTQDGRKLEMKFLAGKKDSTMDIIQKSLHRKSWEQYEVTQTKSEEPQFSVRSAGISGLIRRQEREHQSIDAVKREALTDLDALMSRAKEVVAVIDRYAHMRFDKPDDQSDTSSEIGDAAVLEGILLNIGMSSSISFYTSILFLSCYLFLPQELSLQ